MHPLTAHIHKITGSRQSVGEAELLSFFDTRTFAKKAMLQHEEQRCDWYYFVVKGCLRLYFTDDSGVEQTLQLALENWWLTDLDAFRSGQSSTCGIQALEATEVLTISAANYALLTERIPLVEKYFRLVYERAYAATLQRVRMISRMPKKEFYQLFETRYPEFMQRIPQKILASFLGFTPEYLSELRRQRVPKQQP